MVHSTTSTTVPSGCSTVTVAEVNARSSIASVQLGLGQPGAPETGVSGGNVTTENGVLPFFTSSAGIACEPVTVIGAGFWPGAWFPPWLVHVDVTSAIASMVISTSPFPSPDNAPSAVRVMPLSKNVGSAFFPPFRWTGSVKSFLLILL